MGGGWLLLGFRVARIAPERLGGNDLHKPYLSASESMIDMLPDDTAWYSSSQSALEVQRAASHKAKVIGVACAREQRELIAKAWVPPVDTAYIPIRARALAEVDVDSILGFEPVALEFQMLLSWRYFGGDEIEWLFRRRYRSLSDNGLVASYDDSVYICEQMKILTAAEGYDWSSLMIFTVR